MMNHKQANNDNSEQTLNSKTAPSFWRIIVSTLAAAFGVQSRKNLEQDFKHGNIKVYILAGLIFTTLFVGAVIFIVNLVLLNAN